MDGMDGMWYESRMLSPEQKQQIERLAAEQLRRNWGVVKARPLAAAIDDIRARLVEEAWFSRPLTEVSNEVQRAAARHELYGKIDSEVERAAEREPDGETDRNDAAER